MAYWIQIGRRLNIPNQTNTMRFKDKAAPLVTTKEIMPIKSNVTRLFNIICLFSKNYAKISRIAKNELFMSFSPQQR